MNSKYRDRAGSARRKGFSPSNLSPGAVFTVEDQAVYFPTDEGKRTFHQDRWAIVVQSQWCSEDRPKTVLVVPCSSSGAPDRGDLPLPQEVLNGKLFTAPAVTAYVMLLQPCPKKCLAEYKGHLDDDTWGLFFARVASMLGLSVPDSGISLPPRT